MRLKMVIAYALVILIMSGCGSARKSPIFVDDSRRVIPVMPGDVLRTIEGDTILDFRGAIITRGRFFYLLRCENYVIKEGVRP